MKIIFSKNQPERNYYRIGVRENNLTDKLEFEVDMFQDDVDLSSFQAYLKVVSIDRTFADKIELIPTINQKTEKICLEAILTSSITKTGCADFQLEFVDFNAKTLQLVPLWQTQIFNVAFDETLAVDEVVIQNTSPEILKSIDFRLNHLEESSTSLLEYNNYSEFPNSGEKNALYLAKDERCIYCYDTETKKYILVGTDYNEIDIIDGAVE